MDQSMFPETRNCVQFFLSVPYTLPNTLLADTQYSMKWCSIELKKRIGQRYIEIYTRYM